MPEHNRRSIRLKRHDYRDGGVYFVTICTQNMQCVFGNIRNGMMGLNDMGCVVADELQKTPTIRAYVTLDTWVIMPNHVHILLYIDDPTHCRVMARHDPTDVHKRHFAQPESRSLGTIIGSFKSACSKRIHTFDPHFAWQRNYYEHISRSRDETARIRRYILNNPARWTVDRIELFS